MSSMTLDRTDVVEETTLTREAVPSPDEPFDLDIATIEVGEAADRMIQMTDDNCGSSCPNACTTSVV